MMCWNHVRLLELMLSCKFRSAWPAQASFYSGEGVVYVGKVMHQPDLEGYILYVTKVYVAIMSAIIPCL